LIHFLYKRSYLKTFDALTKEERNFVITADDEIRQFYLSQKAAYGLRIKKLYENKDGQVFEARLSLALRIVWVRKKEEVAFVVVGDHNTVKKFLKNL
jgi:uncharacterized protein YpbB